MFKAASPSIFYIYVWSIYDMNTPNKKFGG